MDAHGTVRSMILAAARASAWPLVAVENSDAAMRHAGVDCHFCGARQQSFRKGRLTRENVKRPGSLRFRSFWDTTCQQFWDSRSESSSSSLRCVERILSRVFWSKGFRRASPVGRFDCQFGLPISPCRVAGRTRCWRLSPCTVRHFRRSSTRPPYGPLVDEIGGR